MSSKNLAQGGAVIYPASKSPEFYTPRWLREAVWRRPRPRPPGYKLSKADLRQLKLV